MVIDNLDSERVAVTPFEAKSPLPVYAYAVLTCTIAAQGFEPIAGKDGQITQLYRGIEFPQLPAGNAFDGSKPPARHPQIEPFGILVLERPYHRVKYRNALR